MVLVLFQDLESLESVGRRGGIGPDRLEVLRTGEARRFVVRHDDDDEIDGQRLADWRPIARRSQESGGSRKKQRDGRAVTWAAVDGRVTARADRDALNHDE